MNQLNSIILECSESKGVKPDPQASEWKTTFREPFLVEEGDQIVIKQCLVNATNGSTNIILDKDTTVSIQVGYYSTIPYNDGIYPDPDPKHFRYKMRIGTDDANQWIPQSIINTMDLGNPAGDTENYQWATNPAYLRHKYFVMYNKAKTGPVEVRDGNVANGYYIDDTAGDRIDNAKIKPYDANNDETTGCYKRTFSYTFPAGSYQPEEIADILTQEMSKSDKFIITNTSSHEYTLVSDVFMCSIDRATTYQVKKPNGDPATGNPDDLPACYNFFTYDDNPDYYNQLIGSTSTQLKYEDNKFKFALHTPMFQLDSGNTVPIVATTYRKLSDGTLHEEDFSQITGCFITKLSSDDNNGFWDSLGFTQAYCQTNVYPTDINGVNSAISRTDFETFISGQFFANSNRPVNGQPLQLVPDYQNNDRTVVSQSQDVAYIEAETEFQSSSGGYYLIEANTGLTNNRYYDISNRKSTVSAIASKNYTQENYITVYQDSAIPYIHSGAPKLISNVDIRITEPKTGKVSKGLSPDSSVFLEIIKNPANQNKK